MSLVAARICCAKSVSFMMKTTAGGGNAGGGRDGDMGLGGTSGGSGGSAVGGADGGDGTAGIAGIMLAGPRRHSNSTTSDATAAALIMRGLIRFLDLWSSSVRYSGTEEGAEPQQWTGWAGKSSKLPDLCYRSRSSTSPTAAPTVGVSTP